jgi:hypothetical protein
MQSKIKSCDGRRVRDKQKVRSFDQDDVIDEEQIKILQIDCLVAHSTCAITLM